LENMENRRKKRIFHKADVQFKILGEQESRGGHGYRQAMTKNISEGGLCIGVPFAVEEGNVLMLDLKLDLVSAEISAISEIVWCRRVYEGYEAGVSFINLADKDRLKLADFTQKKLS